MSAGPPGPEHSAGGSRGAGRSGGGQPARRPRARAVARAGWEARLRASAEEGSGTVGRDISRERVRASLGHEEKRTSLLRWTTLDTDPAGEKRRARRT